MKFKTKDKVFAKMRGYPAWPAKILELNEIKTPNKNNNIKYKVFFYGTRETGSCREEELYSYIDYKEKYGKGVKRKFFNEALAEIECEYIADNLAKANEQQSDKEMNEKSEEYDEKSEKINETEDVTMETYKQKDTDNIDETLNDNLEPSVFKLYSSLPNGMINIKGQMIKALTLDNKLIIINVDQFLPPEIYKTDEEIQTWEFYKFNQLKKVKEQIEKGEKVDEIYKKIIEYQSTPEFQMKIQSQNKHRITQMKLEVKLLELNISLRDSLCIESPNCDYSLIIMDEILNLPINALMLKKHPEVVYTCSKIQSYHLPDSEFILNEDSEDSLNKLCEQIRNKAKLICDKFKSILSISETQCLITKFEKEIEIFNKATKNMSAFDLYTLNYDPVMF